MVFLIYYIVQVVNVRLHSVIRINFSQHHLVTVSLHVCTCVS